MTFLLIIIGIILVLFLIVRPLFNKVNSHISGNDWDWFISNPEIDKWYQKKFNIKNINYVVEKIMKPFNINYTAFSSNMNWLLSEGNSYKLNANTTQAKYNLFTPSIKDLSDPLDRPPMPIWYLAAFPDISKWCNDENISMEEQMEKLYEGFSEEDGILDFNWQSNEYIDFRKKTVENYLRNVKPFLETQTAPIKIK